MLRLLLCFSFLLPNVLSAQSTLKEIKSFGQNPGNLKLFVFEPSIVRPERGFLLVIHGCTQYANTLSDESGLNALAEKAGIPVVYAQQSSINNPSRCFNWFLPRGSHRDGAEIKSLMSMVSYAEQTYAIQKGKALVFGLSAGACMALNMASLYPDSFRGIIALGAAPMGMQDRYEKILNQSTVQNQSLITKVKSQLPADAQAYPRIILVHGKDDRIVNEKSSQLVFLQWAAAYGCDTFPDRKRVLLEAPKAIASYFENSNQVEVLVTLELNALGHALAIDLKSEYGAAAKPGVFTKDYGFHLPLWIFNEFGLLAAKWTSSQP